MGLKFHAKQLELKCSRKPVTHLRILSRKVNLIQFVLPKDHYSRLVGGRLKEEKRMTGKAANCQASREEHGRGKERRLIPKLTHAEWTGRTA